MRNNSLRKLRTHLLILLILIFIPVLGLLVFRGYEDRRQSLTEIQHQARRLIRLFIDEHGHIAESTRQLLEILSRVPAVRNLDLEECNKFLKTIHQHNPQYSTIIAADRNGIIECCAIPLIKPIDVRDRRWFRRISETKNFVIDEFLISRSANKASLPFAYPILDDSGNLRVAVGAAFDLSYYKRIFDKIPMPPDSVIIITDRNKNILYLSSASKIETRIGQSLAQIRGFSVPDHSKGSFAVTDADNVKRIYWFEHLSMEKPNHEICLFVGFSKNVIFEKADRLMYINISVLIFVAFLSLGIAWIFGENFIIKPVNLLVRKIRRISEGDMRVSETACYPIQEIDLLSQAFDDMVHALSLKETENRQAAEALRQSEQNLRAVMNIPTCAVVVHDRDGILLDGNSTLSERFGKPLAEMIGKSLWDLFPPSVSEKRKAKAEEVLQIRRPIRFEDERGGKWHDIILNPILDETGEVVKIVGLGTDITERKQAEKEIRRLNEELEERVRSRTAQLEAANKELESFSYSVSHDLRAPLRSIDGWSLALAEDCADQLDETGKKYLSRIREETLRVGNLIEDMLRLSRMSRCEMRITRLDLSELAENIVFKLREAEPSRAVEMVIQPGLTADADAGMMEIVLTNLLGNAWKFTEKIPDAEIGFGKLGDSGREIFFVKDNGAGFDMAYSAKLFGAFQRLHKASEFPGTGIGLAVVQRSIHRHGGRVWAEGAVNQGATFYFTLREAV